MAKKSVIYRNIKRRKLVEKNAAKRIALKAVIKNKDSSPEEIWQAQVKLQALPPNSSPTRVRNRCALTGRGRGVYRRFGLGRNILLKLLRSGDVPGVIKASW